MSDSTKEQARAREPIPNSQVKRRIARIVLRWVITLEVLVLNLFCFCVVLIWNTCATLRLIGRKIILIHLIFFLLLSHTQLCLNHWVRLKTIFWRCLFAYLCQFFPHFHSKLRSKCTPQIYLEHKNKVQYTHTYTHKICTCVQSTPRKIVKFQKHTMHRPLYVNTC